MLRFEMGICFMFPIIVHRQLRVIKFCSILACMPMNAIVNNTNNKATNMHALPGVPKKKVLRFDS